MLIFAQASPCARQRSVTHDFKTHATQKVVSLAPRAHRRAIYRNGNQANEIKQKTTEQPASRTAAIGSKPTTKSAEAHIPISIACRLESCLAIS